MANRIRLFAPVVVLWAIASSCVLAHEPARSRRAFADAMNKVKEGMPEAEVIALLGQPDDVTSDKDWGIRIADTLKIWRYGTSGHKKPATLGQVCIDDHHRVQYLSGQGTPPAEGVFTEPELRRLLEALNELPELNGNFYNPRPVIRAVNLLQPLGKEKALTAIDEFLRVSFDFTDRNSREGVILLLRALFEVPAGPTVFVDGMTLTPGIMPPVYGGMPQEIRDKNLLPRFPITMEGDIPYFLKEGYNIEGRPETPEPYAAYFRKFGTLRARPLAPTAKPVEALEAFEKSPRWYFKQLSDKTWDYDKRERILLGNQVMRLLDTVYQIEPDDSGKFIGYGSDARNRKTLLQASKLAIRWDAKQSKYTFLDGTSLTPPDPNRYSTQWWEPKVLGLKIEFTVKRDSRKYVQLELYQTYELGKPASRAILRVSTIKAPKKVLHEFPVSVPDDIPSVGTVPPGTTGGVGTGVTTDLAEGEQIRAVLTIGGKSYSSPVFKP